MGMLEDERRRRGMAPTMIERLIGIGMLALIPITAFVFGWMLFV
jgi:hypothetical protein